MSDDMIEVGCAEDGDRRWVKRPAALPPVRSETLLAAIQKELSESFDLAEGQLAAEKLSGNRVKEEFWQGELAALHRMRHVVEANIKET